MPFKGQKGQRQPKLHNCTLEQDEIKANLEFHYGTIDYNMLLKITASLKFHNCTLGNDMLFTLKAGRKFHNCILDDDMLFKLKDKSWQEIP